MVAHRSQKPESLKVTSTEGLEGLFHGDGGVAEGLLDPGCRVEEKGLTLKEACRYFGLSSTSIRLKLKLGEIAGIKRDGPNGPEWRIYPDGLPEGLECSAQADLDDHPESTVVSEYNQGVVTVEPGSYDPGASCPYHNVEYFIQEKYKIVGLTPASGNTANIGSFPTAKIDELRQGKGPFTLHGKEICDEFWRHYPKKAADRKYSTVDEFLALKSQKKL